MFWQDVIGLDPTNNRDSNSKILHNSYPVPGTILSSLYILIHLILPQPFKVGVISPNIQLRKLRHREIFKITPFTPWEMAQLAFRPGLCDLLWTCPELVIRSFSIITECTSSTLSFAYENLPCV